MNVVFWDISIHLKEYFKSVYKGKQLNKILDRLARIVQSVVAEQSYQFLFFSFLPTVYLSLNQALELRDDHVEERIS